jgi:hypothetical protein
MRLLKHAAVVILLAGPAVAAAPSAFAATAGPAVSARLADMGSTAFATPGSATPGASVTFTVNCSQGLNAGGAAAILDGSSLGLPGRIPMNAINGSLFNFSITVWLPNNIQPGWYAPHIDCPGGVPGATANLHVLAVPRGAAATGDGTTSTTTNGWIAVTGLATAGAGLLAGALALRRRRSAAGPDC